MKKLSFLFILVLLAQLAVAQGNFAKKISASDEAINDPKKKVVPKTWIARGDLFTQVAEAPADGLISGMDDVSIGLVLKAKPAETKTWTSADGTTYNIAIFDDKELYYAPQEGRNILQFYRITKTEVDEPMQKALEAYNQASTIDPKATANKSLKEGYQKLSALFKSAATADYFTGNYEGALENFKGEYACNSSIVVGMVDTITMYNIAFLASSLGKYDVAEEFFRKCIDNGHIKDGDLYANLADVMVRGGKESEAEQLLVEAYKKFPNNQAIIIGIINMYMQKGDDPLKALTYIHEAQKNEPENASLYNAEAMLYEKLGKPEEAAKSYRASIARDPNNFYAQYQLGYLHYQNAVEYSKKADDLPLNDQAGYDRYIKMISDELRSSIAPLEEAHRISPDEPIVIELLKNVFYRFKDESPEMEAKYTKYDNLFKASKQE